MISDLSTSLMTWEDTPAERPGFDTVRLTINSLALAKNCRPTTTSVLRELLLSKVVSLKQPKLGLSNCEQLHVYLYKTIAKNANAVTCRRQLTIQMYT